MIPTPNPEFKQQLEDEGLRYINDSSPGFFREKVGKEFSYYDLEGKKIKDSKILERIESLRIPPAWEDVWVSPKANGYLQVTGRDEKRRKQYLYHPDWLKVSQDNKFSKLVDFGLNLPVIRQKVRHDMQSRKLDKRKLLATIIWLLEHTFIRVGNEVYSQENKSYGLTTLRNRHVSVKDETIRFRFKGKSGVDHVLQVSHPVVAKTIKQCIELPGYELFQFIDENGNRHVIDSADVNLFLKDITKDEFSAKDFRTWGGTNLSANHFYETGPWENEKSLKKTIQETVKHVSKHLGNTVAVCRSYYIHPKVVESYQTNSLIPHFDTYKKNRSKKPGLSWDEYALITLLQKGN